MMHSRWTMYLALGGLCLLFGCGDGQQKSAPPAGGDSIGGPPAGGPPMSAQPSAVKGRQESGPGRAAVSFGLPGRSGSKSTDILNFELVSASDRSGPGGARGAAQIRQLGCRDRNSTATAGSVGTPRASVASQGGLASDGNRRIR
jgi:hypothetical protein